MQFTINKYTEQQIETVKTCTVKAICAGFETCPTTGTPHIQGAVLGKGNISYKKAQELLGGPCHTEELTKRFEANIRYTQKYCNVLRFEGNRKQGARTDLAETLKAIKRGASTVELIENHEDVVAKYPKSISTCREAFEKEAAK